MKGNVSIIAIAMALIIGLLSVVSSEAGGNRRRGKKKEILDEQDIVETYLDTLNRGREASLIDDRITAPIERDAETMVAETKKSVNGFRIQLMASSSLEKLRMKKDVIESKLNMKVYIEHDEPYYKVYAGDFTERGKADKALVKVKESGYSDAWIVKTRVFVKE